MREQKLSGKTYELEARVDLVASLREEFGISLMDFGVTEDERDFWKLVMSEAVVNAIQHGCGSDRSKTISVAWYLRGKDVHLEVCDPGPGPADVAGLKPHLPLNPLDCHGRGLFLISSFCDQWEHWKGQGGYRQLIVRRHEEIQTDVPGDAVLDQALEELSVCYESLAAFYRLGEGLVRSENVGNFVAQAIEDLLKVVNNDFLKVSFSADLHHSLLADLKRDPHIDILRSNDGRIGKVFSNREEFIWESPADQIDEPIRSEFGCGFCCPIQAAGSCHGVLTIARSDASRFLNTAALNTVRTFADLIGIAVGHASNTITRSREQRALQELEIASDMQEKLLPLPQIDCPPEWTIFLRRRGAREVAGDHIEVLQADDGTLTFAMVDVMGKGISAAFLAAMFRTAFHMSVAATGSLLEVVQLVNRVLCAQVGDMSMFATCCFARVTPDLSSIEFINAGHCPALLFDSSGAMRELEPSGPPLGLFADAAFVPESVPLAGGERVYMVTDGLYEWYCGDDIWGWDHFLAFLRAHEDLDAGSLWDMLQETISKLAAKEAGGRDDQAFFCWELLSASTANDATHG